MGHNGTSSQTADHIDALERAVERAKRNWFWFGVAAGFVGSYLGSLIHV